MFLELYVSLEEVDYFWPVPCLPRFLSVSNPARAVIMTEQIAGRPSKKTYDETYRAADADVSLVCSKRLPTAVFGGVEAVKTVTKTDLHVFRVHSKVLAMTSPFFKDMVDLAGPVDAATSLHEVKMDESVSVIEVLLAAAYQKPEPLAAMVVCKEWQFIFEVWEAANKYSFQLVRVLCSTSLR